ncbi:esterase-like activity of phytase family protein [Algimonas arctica]|nr:esterase-like activity of phytase family protein [Algimonas arctica]
MRFSEILALTVFAFIPLSPAMSVAQQADTDPWNFERMAPNLRHLSCPDDVDVFPFSSLDIGVDPVKLGAPNDVEQALPQGVTFVGGWHLTANNSDFGGLSGLDITETGDLLAVSDRGTFFTIGMANGAPDGRGQMSEMLDAKGKKLSRKRNIDAEGLAYREGLAMVSFERNHRVLAFDLAGCEGVARGVRVSQLPDQLAGQSIKPNGGAEALWIRPDGGLTVGYETVINNRATLLTLDQVGGVLEQTVTIDVPRQFKLVGASGSAYLLRAYNDTLGNRNEIRLTDQNVAFKLASPLKVDNFEGIALSDPEGGARRLYIISDDNFSGRQRTLLYAFDITPS